MTFKIKGCTDTTFQTPVDAAKPLIEAPPIVQYPMPRSFTGEGKPAAAIGLPWAEVGRDIASQTCYTWYLGRLDSNEPALVAVCLWDPKTAAYGTYQAWMHAPTFYGAAPASEVTFTNFRVKFTSCESTTAT